MLRYQVRNLPLRNINNYWPHNKSEKNQSLAGVINTIQMRPGRISGGWLYWQ